MAFDLVPPHRDAYFAFSSHSVLHAPRTLPLHPPVLSGDSPKLVILIRSALRNIIWSPHRTILSLDIPVTSEQRVSMHEASDFTEDFTAKRIINEALLETSAAHNMPPDHRDNLVCKFTTRIQSVIPSIMNTVNLPGVFYMLEITYIQHISKHDPDHEQQQQQQRGEDINNNIEEHVRGGQRVEEDHEEYCPICLDELVPGREVWMPCHHRFHTKCILKWLKNTNSCPLCRRRLGPSSDDHLDQD